MYAVHIPCAERTLRAPLPRRLETNKLRNTAKLFAHLLSTDAIPWAVLQARVHCAAGLRAACLLPHAC